MGAQASDELVALVALLNTRPRKMTWPEISAEVAYTGSAITVWQAQFDDALLPAPDTTAAIEAARQDIDSWASQGLRIVTVLDPEYPQRLLDIRETPPFLFAAGELRSRDFGMSIAGSRHASDRGLAVASAAAQLLVEKGLSVIAGLAAGIDATAHRAALEAGGRTVAFVGTGITKSYPTQNHELQREIADRGLVLSQFWPDAPPTRHSFPIRNAAMSGYGLATIVIEAGETSGTRIQARLAVEHGRPVILTDVVAETTSWGAALAERHRVHVVNGLDELSVVVDKVRGEQDELRAALSKPADAT